MDLADAGTDPRRRLDLRNFGVDEDAGGDAGLAQAGDHVLEPGFLADDVEAALGGHLVPPFRHQHGHFRPGRAGDADHLVSRRHFQVELDLRRFLEPADVGILDVPAILAQMHGDAIGAAQMRLDGAPDGIGFVSAPGLADGGDVVDVDAEFDHSSCNSLKILRVSSSWPPR